MHWFFRDIPFYLHLNGWRISGEDWCAISIILYFLLWAELFHHFPVPLSPLPSHYSLIDTIVFLDILVAFSGIFEICFHFEQKTKSKRKRKRKRKKERKMSLTWSHLDDDDHLTSLYKVYIRSRGLVNGLWKWFVPVLDVNDPNWQSSSLFQTTSAL